MPDRSIAQAILSGNGRCKSNVVLATQEDTMLMFYLPLIIFEASLGMQPWAASSRKTDSGDGNT
jgi:hypothetical protein